MAKYTLTIESDDPAEIAGALNMVEPTVDNYIHDEHGPCQPLQGDAPPVSPFTSDAPVMEVSDTDDDGPTNADAPDTDKRGYPWDERIHASSKALNKDGTWRYRRNTDQSLIDAVEGELRPVDNTGDYLPSAPAADDPLTIPPFLQRTAAPVVTYEQVIAELTAALNAGKIAHEALPGFYKFCGVADVNGLVGNQDALNKAHEKIAGL